MGFFLYFSLMYKSYSVEEAKRKLEYYCSYQERCHEEVISKLRELNMIPQAADAIIAHLIEHNFLNEERFARSFARGKHLIKHWGRRRIVNELRARNISRYNIDNALKEIDPDAYMDAFNALAEKQWETMTETNIYKKKKKVMDYLLRKGFETDIIQNKLSALANE